MFENLDGGNWFGFLNNTGLADLLLFLLAIFIVVLTFFEKFLQGHSSLHSVLLYGYNGVPGQALSYLTGSLHRKGAVRNERHHGYSVRTLP